MITRSVWHDSVCTKWKPLGNAEKDGLLHVLSPVLIYLATDVLTMDKAPRGVQPSRAKRGSAARSAAGRAKRGRPPPLAERSEAVAPEPREGRKRELEEIELEANKHGANQHLREAGKRALHVRDNCTLFLFGFIEFSLYIETRARLCHMMKNHEN